MKRIFLTSITELKDRSSIDYYVCDDEIEYGTYTTAMSIAEAGIKYIISKYDIDEIIVLGTSHCAHKDEKLVNKLSDMHIENIEELSSMSEYGFLCYRIFEFLNQLDIEYADTSELIEDKVKERIKSELKDFKNKYNVAGDREIFYKLCVDIDLYKIFGKEIFNKYSINEKKWTKHYLYSQMDSYYKMHVRDNNINASIRFIDINDRDVMTIDTITNVVNNILNEDNREIELYIDSQGLTPTDGNILFSTFLMANRKIGYKCDMKGLINTKRVNDAFAGKIADAYISYKVQKIVEAIDLFLDYGKDTALKEYWKTLNTRHNTIDALFASMDCIDEGISLCNVDLIIYGMRYIKKVIDTYIEKNAVENIYLDYIINSIRTDYGELISKNDICLYDLLKWTLEKGFYQQTLTIIESKIPDDIVNRGIYYYAKNEKDVDEFLKKINVLYWSEQLKMRWAFNDINHYFIKSYGRFAIDNRQKPDFVARDFAKFKVSVLKNDRDDVAKVYSNLNNDNLLYDLFYAYYRLGTLRNQVNHAVVLENELVEKIILNRKDFRNEIKTEVIKFIDIYERVCKEVKLKDKPISITDQMLKAYVRSHELKILDAGNDLAKHNSYSCEFNGKEVKIDIHLFENDEDGEQ